MTAAVRAFQKSEASLQYLWQNHTNEIDDRAASECNAVAASLNERRELIDVAAYILKPTWPPDGIFSFWSIK